ncbi:MAG TPA: phosphatidylinositol-specific phospholipase C domain-containing protein [Myxococcales bacterium]|jgi:hypothetical protein
MLLALLLAFDFAVPADWMARNAELLRNRQLASVVLPGSHDAASYSLGRGSSVCAARASSAFAALGAFVAAPRARTQEVTLSRQLEAGVRYLDLRVCAVPGEPRRFFMHHTWVGAPAAEALDQIDAFSRAHPREILLLDFQHLSGFDDADRRQFAAELEQRFRGRMLPIGQNPGALTVQKLWDMGVSVLVFVEHPPRSPHLFGREHALVSRWPRARSIRALVDALPWMAEDTAELHVLQWQLTPGFAEFLRHPWSSLIDFAAGANQLILDGTLPRLVPRARMNVVMTDDAAKVAKAIARLNEP